jgi:excisionase family DNA binding protein
VEQTQAQAEWLTVKEVARLLRVSCWTVYQWTKTGELPPPVKIGKRQRFRRETLEQFLKKREQESQLAAVAGA